ncbi:hypothetical protein AAG570_004054 [Ranatra chinensis]|uniref:Uncharacterized protein n=1 Tax=Ranatra chinensis TaxID=642074 RepID=A0ABD0YKS5_9HEMI
MFYENKKRGTTEIGCGGQLNNANSSAALVLAFTLGNVENSLAPAGGSLSIQGPRLFLSSLGFSPFAPPRQYIYSPSFQPLVEYIGGSVCSNPPPIPTVLLYVYIPGISNSCYEEKGKSASCVPVDDVCRNDCRESADGVPTDIVHAKAGCRLSLKMLPTWEAKRWNPHSSQRGLLRKTQHEGLAKKSNIDRIQFFLSKTQLLF